MSITFSESFEGCTVNAAPSTDETAYDNDIGDTGNSSGKVVAVVDGSGVRGKSVKFIATDPGSGLFGFLGKNVDEESDQYFRRYYRIDELPSFRTSILLAKTSGITGGSHNGSVALGGTSQSGKFCLVNGDTVETTADSDIPLDEWFRLEWRIEDSGTQTLRIFLGENLHGDTADEEITAGFGTDVTAYIEDGIMTNPNVGMSVWVDEVVNSNSDWVGPLAVATTPQLSEDFEANDFTKWTSHTGATIGTTYAHAGTYGCQLLGANSPAAVVWGTGKVPQSHPWASVRMYFYIAQAPSSTTQWYLFELLNSLTSGNKHQFEFMIDLDGSVQVNFDNTQIVTLDEAPALGEWHKAEARIFYGDTTYTAIFRYDGVEFDPLHFSGTSVATATSLQVSHPGQNVTGEIWVDDIALWVGDADGGYIDGESPAPVENIAELKRWDTAHSQFRTGASLKRWDSDNEQFRTGATLRYLSGSAWVPPVEVE